MHLASRRTTIIMIVLACLAVVLAVAIPTLRAQLGRGGESVVLPENINPSPRPGCPDRETDTSGVRTLDAGATSLLWCPMADPMRGFDPPTEPLTTGLDQWVDAYNGLKKPPRSLSCTAMGAPTYAYVLSYPDGRTQTIIGSRGGCGFIGSRLGAEAIEKLTTQLFVQQRESGRTPVTAPHDPCSPQETILRPALAHVDRLIFCVWVPGASGPQPVAVPEPDLAAVLADLRANLSKSIAAGEGRDGPPLMMLAPDGDRLSLSWSASTGSYVSTGQAPFSEWKPSPASLAALRAVLRAPKPGATINACRQGLATPLAAGATLPSGAVKVWLCSEQMFAPQDPLTTGVADLIAASSSTTGCSWGTSLVAEYADGKRQRLPVAACQGTTPQPTFAVGQSSLVATFVRQLQTQRSDQGVTPPPVSPEPVKFCDGRMPSLVPVTPQAATSTRFCAFTPAGGLWEERHTEGMVVSAAEHTALVTDLLAHSRGSTQPFVDPYGTSLRGHLAMLLPSGDRMWVYSVKDKPGLYWQHPESLAWQQWTPSSAATEIFARWATK